MRLCPLVQLVLRFRADPVDGLPGWCEHHLAGCQDCRAERGVAVRLVQALREGAIRTRRVAPPFLASRIAHTANREARHSTSRYRPWGPRLALGLLGATVAFAIGVGFWFHGPATNRPGATSAASASPVLPTRLGMELPDGGTLLAFSEKLDAPLEREWQLMIADARSAARSLTAAFLPESLVQF